MAYASGRFAATGDAQASSYILRGTTSNTNPTELFLDGASQRMILATNSTWSSEVSVTGRSSMGVSAGFKLQGLIRNNNGTTALVPGDASAYTRLGYGNVNLDAQVVADDSDDALSIKVQGLSGTSIRWVTTVRAVEVGY
jgi:hypothetical protein